MGRAAEMIYGYLQRNAVDVESTFCLPPGQVIEIGTQIDL
jgi:K+ transporter